MARTALQLEFKWTAWLRRLRRKPARKTPLPREDGGLSAWCSEQASGLSLLRLARKVKVCWNTRMQSTAGRACWPDCVIELNPRLKGIGEDELWRTLRHELAHLVAYERSSRRSIAPHGPEWQLACAELGIPGEQPYHELPLPTRAVRHRHIYVCRHCQTELQRVKPIRRAVACYDCCRKFNKGYYDDRFRMVKKPPAA